MADPSGQLTLADVQQPAQAEHFRRGDQVPTTMEEPGAAYWLRLVVQAKGSLMQHWYLELLDSHLSDITFYPFTKSEQGAVHTGADYRLSSRKFPYKNFLFRLPLEENQTRTYYIRLESNSKTSFVSRLRTEQPLAVHFQTEYVLLGAFYGVLLIMVVYNLCLYLFIGEQTYLRYVLYVLSCSLVFLSEDGLGFQYLWPDFPAMNQLVIALSPILLLFTFSYYARQFLDAPQRLPDYDPWVRRVVLISISLLLLDTLWLHSGWGFWFYLIPYGILYCLAFLVWRGGFRPARFFLLAHALVAISVCFMILRKLGINTFTNTATVYSMNAAFVIEVVVLSYALGEKIKAIKDATIRAQGKLVKQLRKKHQTQDLLVEQLRQNQELKDQLNTELEALVTRRTEELRQQSETIAAQNRELLHANGLLALQSAAIEKLNTDLRHDLQQAQEARVLSKEVDFGEFSQIYPDKDACLRYLAELKWVNGYQCRRCGHEKYCDGREPHSRRCTRCRYVESATAYTLLQKCKFSTVKAFYAVFLLYTHNGNYSSQELSRVLDLRQGTCWSFSQKVLEAIRRREQAVDYEANESWTHILLDANDDHAEEQMEKQDRSDSLS
ncbi:7TM diverse intracellular signaling domain-containing protein [Hymenobacter sp. GOD-10R]|uniref:7TM diverse intracellular signaling domain-containing protein n=1 Tax=Hymenobacter sp. GOD-10R TaxID=3093922 RepID=UPI002D78262E|nr:7TM diverse intracellular signaling domain-containing protein [Hymenobacter sp. GOD-10R]WRQ26809.1 7TM diverse intracellular signaling domain-containing protein [Hymenobacter sp. GOD-10R]